MSHLDWSFSPRFAICFRFRSASALFLFTSQFGCKYFQSTGDLLHRILESRIGGRFAPFIVLEMICLQQIYSVPVCQNIGRAKKLKLLIVSTESFSIMGRLGWR